MGSVTPGGKFIPPLDVPDRFEDRRGYSRAVHFNALARVGWERRVGILPSGHTTFGGATRSAAPPLGELMDRTTEDKYLWMTGKTQ